MLFAFLDKSSILIIGQITLIIDLSTIAQLIFDCLFNGTSILTCLTIRFEIDNDIFNNRNLTLARSIIVFRRTYELELERTNEITLLMKRLWRRQKMQDGVPVFHADPCISMGLKLLTTILLKKASYLPSC